MCKANPVYLRQGCFCNRFRLSTHFISFKASSAYEPGVLSDVMEGCGTSLHGLRVYVARRPQPPLRSDSSFFPVASTAEDIFALKSQDNRYQAVRDEIKKVKAGKHKDKEGLWDGNKAEVDNEQILRCKMILAHY